MSAVISNSPFSPGTENTIRLLAGGDNTAGKTPSNAMNNYYGEKPAQ